MLSNGVTINFPVVIKAKASKGGRFIEVEASNENVDLEGDVILQQALLDAAPGFLASGHLDINHYSEILPDRDKFIIGKPINVFKGDGTSTIVQAKLRQYAVFDPENNVSDYVWQCLTTKPDIKWYASVYGIPQDREDFTYQRIDDETGATRYVIKALEWKSLALTQHPVNNTLTKFARIMKCQEFMDMLKKSDGFVNFPQRPSTPDYVEESMDVQDIESPNDLGQTHNCNPEFTKMSLGELSADGNACSHCGHELSGNVDGVLPWYLHFSVCRGLDNNTAEILARACADWVREQLN